MTAQCEGVVEVGSARYEPALLPPCLSIRVLSYSNCQEIHSRQQTGLAVQVLINRNEAHAAYQTDRPEYRDLVWRLSMVAIQFVGKSTIFMDIQIHLYCPNSYVQLN